MSLITTFPCVCKGDTGGILELVEEGETEMVTQLEGSSCAG